MKGLVGRRSLEWRCTRKRCEESRAGDDVLERSPLFRSSLHQMLFLMHRKTLVMTSSDESEAPHLTISVSFYPFFFSHLGEPMLSTNVKQERENIFDGLLSIDGVAIVHMVDVIDDARHPVANVRKCLPFRHLSFPSLILSISW